MNIRKVLQTGYYTPQTKGYAFTFQYPHQKVIGFDSLGRRVVVDDKRTQTVYGIYKYQCLAEAKRYLTNENYYASRHVIPKMMCHQSSGRIEV